jgi:hypothetical protein
VVSCFGWVSGARMTARSALGLGAVVVACGLLAMLAARPPEALASANPIWATGVEAVIPHSPNVVWNPNVSLGSVSCASPGNCSAVGSYNVPSFFASRQGLLLTQTSGAWAPSVQAGLPADAGQDPDVVLDAVSCPSAGDCSAVGNYVDGSGNAQGVLLSETSGAWATGVKAVLPAGASSNPGARGIVLSSVSCPSAGNCTAVGTYTDSSGSRQGLLLTQTSGAWAPGVQAVLPAGAAGVVSLSSVSCPSAGNCTAVGNYTDSSGFRQGLLLTQSSGTWASGVQAGLPRAVPNNFNPGVVLNSVSCASAGNCSAVGGYYDPAGFLRRLGLLLTQSSGAWAPSVDAVPPAGAGSDPNVFLNAVSCPSAGNCTAVGYLDSSVGQPGLLLTQSAGAWATGVKAGLPTYASSTPNVVLGSVSCPSTGNCTAVGGYRDSSFKPLGLLLTQSTGAWATGVKAGLPTYASSTPNVVLGSVSCPSTGNCSAVGTYVDSAGYTQGLLLSAAPVSPMVWAGARASATAGSPIAAASIWAGLGGGAEPTGTLTFRVFGPQSAPPVSCTAGGTTVGSASVAGNGTYHPSAGFTPASPGHYWWYASYGGDPSDNPAASACGETMAETVVSAAPPPPDGAKPPAGAATPPVPALSAVKLGANKFAARNRTTLKLTVSQAARIKVRITQTVKGHKVKGVCKRHAKTGKRCTIKLTRRTLTYSARAGANAFKLKLQGLAKGAYTAAITAQDASGKSRTIKLTFTITHK